MTRFLALFLLAALPVSAQSSDPRQVYQTLNGVRVDPAQIYFAREVHVRSEAARLVLNEGKLAFLTAHDGLVTGAVFSGLGRVLAIPRDAVEKGTLARAAGAPLLDLEFTRAYLRFNDATAESLKSQLAASSAKPAPDASFATEWDVTVTNLNPWHSLRILTDRLSAAPLPYFYAGLVTPAKGAIEILYDPRRAEAALIGQSLVGQGGGYRVWASYAAAESLPNPAPVSAAAFTIETTVRPDGSIAGKTTLRLRALRDGERVVPLQISRSLTVQSVSSAPGESLAFLQTDESNRFEVALRGNQMVYAVLAQPTRAGQEFALQVAYEGRALTDTGNNLFFAGERGSWYPHLAGPEEFSAFELTFRWPKALQLHASGRPVEEREDGEWRVGRWQSEALLPMAGFHVGEYALETLEAGALRLDLASGRQPLARELGTSVADSIRFFEKFGGPFPFARLSLAPASGPLGQGWPGLAFVSSTMPQQAPPSALVPFHEVAHQWWGALVGRRSYRDEWIHEGLAQYLALLYTDSKQPDGKAAAAWLARARDDLTRKPAGSVETADEAGPLVIGPRLRAAATPEAYEKIIYGKGPWVFHMLRLMMREPESTDPDARFANLLRSLVESHRHKPLSTEDFKRAVEGVMNKSMDLEGDRRMDWFFDQWVYSTGIPHYTVEFQVKPQGQNFIVSGKLFQSEVPDWFLAAVPLYAAGSNTPLGVVITDGPETEFQFTTRTRPAKVVIDPNLTLLCVTP